MDAVVQNLKDWKGIANRITQRSIERRTQLLSQTHVEAAHRIAGIKEDNAQELRRLEVRLKEENEEKERAVIARTEEIMEAQRRAGEAHLPEIVDLLYTKVITVEE
jgi:hypothetical protein